MAACTEEASILLMAACTEEASILLMAACIEEDSILLMAACIDPGNKAVWNRTSFGTGLEWERSQSGNDARLERG